jgi:hypothetical protein
VQRLGQNVRGYSGETIDILGVLRRIESAALAFGWRWERFTLPQLSHNSTADVLALHRQPEKARARAYVSAGIHGDEPAGPLAVERMLIENRWPADVALTVCPCLNRTGFPLNTRENAAGIDLNRDYRQPRTPEVQNHVAWLETQPSFDAAFCLHEDWESHGFYLYELNPDQRPSLARAIVEAVRPVCPVDESPLIDGREAHLPGIIVPPADPTQRPQWPEAFHLFQKKTRLSYTLEAPSDWPLPIRVNALVAGMRAALSAMAPD